jgi:hypothetical protein
MLAAFMLREFVFDLVDAMAAARSPAAAKLDRRLKRYLGVGNSAGLGLIPFVANHPQIVHQWCLVNEQAFAEAKARSAMPGSDTCRKLLTLLDKTVQYFKQDPRDGNGIFASYDLLARQFATIADHAATLIGPQANVPARPWAELADWVATNFHPEAAEMFNGLLLELYPDIVAAHETELTIAERMDVQPDMPAATLKAKARFAYDWLLSTDTRVARDTTFFWYYPVEAPYEPRRGRRGPAPDYELESNMDLPLKLAGLMRVLDEAPEDTTVASLLAARPDLRAVITRIQSVADFPYAELRENFLSTSFTPFATCRFLLSFYGMEKYDPRPPRSTKGALLQGAPVAAEIEAQVEGEWPFPLAPELGAGAQEAPKLPPLRVIEAQETSVRRIQELAAKAEAKPKPGQDVTIFPLEFGKLLTKALLSGGQHLGDAEFIVELARLSETLRQGEFDLLLAALEGEARTPVTRIDGLTIDAGKAPAFAVAAAALDLACADAARRGRGAVVVRNASRGPLLLALPVRAAERGFVAVVADIAQGDVVMSGPGSVGPWWIKFTHCCPDWAAELIASGTLPAVNLGASGVDGLLGGAGASANDVSGFALLCFSPSVVGSDALFASARARADGTTRSSSEFKQARDAVDRVGFAMPQARFERLFALAKRALIPEAVERLIVPSQ